MPMSSPTDGPPEGIDWRQIFAVALDVACVGYLLWTFSPTVRLTVTSLVTRARAEMRARQQAEHDRAWMNWTLHEIRALPETDKVAR
jgi:hypothetical protein